MVTRVNINNRYIKINFKVICLQIGQLGQQPSQRHVSSLPGALMSLHS